MQSKQNINYKVYDAMTSNPVIISKDASIQSAAKLMAENKVASLVVAENKKFLGLLTEKDIVRKVASENLNTTTTKVKNIMTTRVQTISPKDDLKDAVKKIGENGQKQLPVLEGNILVGFLTFKDIMRVQPKLFELVYGKYAIKEEDRKPIFVEDKNEGLCSMCGDYSHDLAVAEEDEEEICPNCNSYFN